jgi:hypothetical protein
MLSNLIFYVENSNYDSQPAFKTQNAFQQSWPFIQPTQIYLEFSFNSGGGGNHAHAHTLSISLSLSLSLSLLTGVPLLIQNCIS